MNDDQAPKFSADFAERVLSAADGVRLRRRVARGGVVALAIALVSMWALVPARAPHRAPELLASDFAWLDEVSAGPTDMNAMLFPDGDTVEREETYASLMSSL